MSTISSELLGLQGSRDEDFSCCVNFAPSPGLRAIVAVLQPDRFGKPTQPSTTMQINFYMDQEDRHQFHTFLFERGGYLTPEISARPEALCFSSPAEVPDGGHTLKIFRESIFPRASFDDPEWITPYPQFNGYFIHGPGMQYSPSWQDEAGIHRGRIYMGLVGTSSFVKPGKPRAAAHENHADAYRKLENFYQACCRYLRKHFRKDDAGIYHGPGSDRAATNGAMKLQM